MSGPLHRALNGALVALCAAGPTLVAAAPATAAGWPGTVSVTGALNVRTGPSTATAVVATLRNGARISISCAATGEQIAGEVRSTRQWDRLTSGRYVSHGYVRTSARVPACPPGTVPPAPQTPSNAWFIANAVPGAQQGWREFGVPASVTIAQAILESGWGRSALSANDRNYFGIKCFDGPGAIANGCHTYRTFECDGPSHCYQTEASFRTYALAADSFRDHGHFLRGNPRYRPAFAYTRSPDEFLRQIWKAGYATDPEYDSKVIGLMRSYDLYRYDIWR